MAKSYFNAFTNTKTLQIEIHLNSYNGIPHSSGEKFHTLVVNVVSINLMPLMRDITKLEKKIKKAGYFYELRV